MSSYGFVDGETYLISGKVSELDVQFRKCFDCVSPDTEDLINILSSVHTQLQLFLDSDLSEVETVLNHVYSCTYIEGVTDLASILLEPFRTDTRFDSYFLFKDLHSPKDRRYSFADSDLGRTDKEWSTGSGEGFKEALQERISYTPSWDKEKEGRILRESTSQKEEQRPPKRLLGGRPLRADARAFSADMVRDILPSDITIPSRLAIATGSIASNLEEFSVSMPLVPRIGSEGICADIQTPKGVGKYTADGRRVHSIVASKRSAFVNRRLNHAAEGGISDCIPLTVNTITGDEDLKQNVLAEKENGAPPVAAISSSNFRSVGEEAEGRIDFVYLTHAELTPSFSPARDIDKVALALPTQEWPDIFHTLNLVRSLALHHAPRLLASPHLKGIVAAITKLVDNLRSALAKNAMLALSDFFSFLSMSGMESEIQRSIDCLVKVQEQVVYFPS